LYCARARSSKPVNSQTKRLGSFAARAQRQSSLPKCSASSYLSCSPRVYDRAFSTVRLLTCVSPTWLRHAL
jgi:hypothetical protein